MINPKLGRTKSHREMMLANLARSVVKAEKVKTTLPRARAARRLVERWITIAKRANSGDILTGQKRLYQFVQDRILVDKLINDLAVRSKDRAGGYTRLLKVGNRVGDASPMVVLTLVDKPKAVKADAKAKSKAKEKAAK